MTSAFCSYQISLTWAKRNLISGEFKPCLNGYEPNHLHAVLVKQCRASAGGPSKARQT